MFAKQYIEIVNYNGSCQKISNCANRSQLLRCTFRCMSHVGGTWLYIFGVTCDNESTCRTCRIIFQRNMGFGAVVCKITGYRGRRLQKLLQRLICLKRVKKTVALTSILVILLIHRPKKCSDQKIMILFNKKRNHYWHYQRQIKRTLLCCDCFEILIFGLKLLGYIKYPEGYC